MRRRLLSAVSLAAALAWLAACGSGVTAAVPAAPGASAPVAVRVIAFNDFHGHLESGGLSLTLPDPAQPGAVMRVPSGGAAALAGLVRALRDAAPQSVLVSSGDLVGATPLVSALFRHEPTVDAMNRLGLDINVLGNHEFDAGSAELKRLFGGGCAASDPRAATQSCVRDGQWTGARFAVLAANVNTADGTPLYAPSWVREFGGVKLGVIGAVTRTTPGIVMPSGVAGLRFGDEADAINRSAAALQAQGVHALVAVVHEGGQVAGPSGAAVADWNDTVCAGLSGRIVDIARRITPAVDLILSAHTHQGYNCLLDGRPVMQAVSYGRGVSVADLQIDPLTGRIARAATLHRNLPVVNTRTDPAQRDAIAATLPPAMATALRAARPDAAVAALVERYVQLAAPRAQREVGRIGGSFDREGQTDSSAGRLVADAQLAATRAPERGGAQLALTNPGGLRTDLPCRGRPPCSVTWGELFAMQPFGNSLVVMSLTGAELKALLESQQRGQRDRPLLLAPSAGFGYRWLSRAPAGQRVQNITLHGQPLAPDARLRVTVNSYLAEGGDGFAGFKHGRDRLGGALDIDALADWLATTPAPVVAPRIEWVE